MCIRDRLQSVWRPLDPPQETRAAIEAGSLKVSDLGDFASAGLGVTLDPGNPWRHERHGNIDQDLAGERILYIRLRRFLGREWHS